MKLDIIEYPLKSRKRAIAQIIGGDLNKGLKTAQAGNINFSTLSLEIGTAINKLIDIGNIGTILSAYYQYGTLSTISVDQLLHKMFSLHDYPSFLKQIYRFNKYTGFEDEIDNCLKWHDNRKMPDAFAWRVKFAKLREQVHLSNSNHTTAINIIDEETSIENGKNVYLELKSIKIESSEKSALIENEDTAERYIYSQVSKNKLEKANKAHSNTLAVLGKALQKGHCSIKESKLIDAFTVIGDKKIIFEIKSITENNEREQIRKAISQLYEYRFLYSLFDAMLCIVFSKKPFSQWLIDYLLTDRQIHVLWVENDEIEGNSLKDILSFLDTNK
jgi:hypothetical protein